MEVSKQQKQRNLTSLGCSKWIHCISSLGAARVGTSTQKLRRAPGLLILGIAKEIFFYDQMQWRTRIADL